MKGLVISMKHDSTGEILETTTNQRGEYVFDAANFLTAASAGQTVTLSQKHGRPSYDDNINVENGRIELQ